VTFRHASACLIVATSAGAKNEQQQVCTVEGRDWSQTTSCCLTL